MLFLLTAVRNGLKALKDNDGHMKSMILTPKRNNTNLKGQLRSPKYSTEKHFGGVDLPEKVMLFFALNNRIIFL